MKTPLKFIFFVLIGLQASCQVMQIVPLRSLENNNGTYQKDIFNEFPFWVGTWKGISNNKEYTFMFTFFQQHQYVFNNGDYLYRDEIGGKFKVVDLVTNQILYDNLATTTYEEYNITNTALYDPVFSFYFFDNENNCCNTAKFELWKDYNNPNQIMYKNFELSGYGCLIAPCSYADQLDIPMFLPEEDLVLTRQ
ncbi:hypothetical protein [Flavobacterium sp. U410]